MFLLALRPLLNPFYRRRTGTALSRAAFVDLGLGGVLDAVRHGHPQPPPEPDDPPPSPEADVIAEAFESLHQHRHVDPP